MEEMLRGMKVRDYYDIYSIINEGYDISEGIKAALRYSQQKLNAKNIMMLLISEKIMPDQNFEQLEPKYKVSKEEMRLYILQKLNTSWFR